MEGYLFKWVNIIAGWKPRYVTIGQGKVEISKSKVDSEAKVYNLLHITITNKEKNEFVINDNEKKQQIHLKAMSEKEKACWIVSIKEQQSITRMEIIEANQLNTNPKQQMTTNEISINKNQSDLSLNKVSIEPRLSLKEYLLKIQNDIMDMNFPLTCIHEHLQTIKDNKHPLFKAYDSFVSIKLSLKENLEYCLEYSNEKLSSEEQSKKKNEYANNVFYDVEEETNTNNKQEVNSPNDSFEDCDDLANFEVNFDSSSMLKLEKRISKKKTSSNWSSLANEYINYAKRDKLNTKIQSSTSMISDMVKAAMKEKGSLPITYNEPISMLQRQIEPFQHFNLLTIAYNQTTVEDRLSYISAFIISGFSLNINRLLKPFNPLLGETYEYFDIQQEFRSISEQVSHHPPISAFIVESPNITVYSDTKHKHKFLLMKGALEMIFSSKTNILFHGNKNSNNFNLLNDSIAHYSYNQPTLYMKGIIYGTPHYDFVGTVLINDEKTETGKDVFTAEIEFIEEGKKGKPLGSIEGKIFKNKEVLYILKGNWNLGLWLYEKTGQTMIKELWKISNEEFITNKDTISNYLLSSYAYDLNNLPENLKNKLPHTDSRFRPDQRLLEEGNIDEAEKVKIALEQEQRNRAKDFENQRKVYKPNYFENVNDSNGSFYIPFKNYWEDREKNNFSHIQKIFDI